MRILKTQKNIYHSRTRFYINYFKMCAWLLSRLLLFATPWAIARQAPLSMEILQAGILEWVAMPSSRGSSQSGIQLSSPALQVDSSLSEPPGKPILKWLLSNSYFHIVYSVTKRWTILSKARTTGQELSLQFNLSLLGLLIPSPNRFWSSELRTEFSYGTKKWRRGKTQDIIECHFLKDVMFRGRGA